MIEFHLGVRPQSFYDAKKLDLELHDKLHAIQKDRFSLQAARDSVRKKKKLVQVDIDPAAFREEMEQAVDHYNVVYAQQQAVLARLKDFRNQRDAIDTELDLLRRGIAELEADYKYAESPDMPDHGNCPTCGTEFENSFVERFGILDDIDHCRALVDQWLKKRVDISESLSLVEAEYSEVSKNLSVLEGLLHRTKENITLSELIASEGMKEMVSSLDSDISILLEGEEVVSAEIEENSANLKLDSKRKKSILEYYQARMKEFLNALNVSVLSESDYDALDKQITNNALGSDRPRSLAAQYYAFLYTMKKFNTFTLCPMIIDSPFQQEQDPTNEEAIMNFLISRRLDGQQLILGTISVDDFTTNSEIANAPRHELKTKYKLLQKNQFSSVNAEIGDMHDITLASDG
ncbi:hypothetical protein [Salipiger thiooxidans]|uniref:hypothetical protein n=1 Tax=Salipiger thiooxidans TaxID=282683 RepID=UPI001CD61A59|nr:hypothetical protein [Salipiger thiooxidans]MCA0848100.1 hypothetical protein [Salipiger thiooxidans]